jgi:RecA-family ATPase
MNYPAKLLPQSDYKKIEWSNDLCPLFLLRYTPTQDLLDDTDKLKEEYIAKQTDHLRDLSTNLLGEFSIEDNKIEVIEKGKDFFCVWNEGEDASEPIYPVDFVINENRGCFYWNIGEVILLEFSHTDNIDNNDYQLNFKVLHTPVKCNFWHFSIRVFSGNHKEVSTLTVRDKLKKALWRKAKEQLRECAIIKSPKFDALDSKHYKR